MSWHLQTLAEYGFVEETSTTACRRSRPWRVTSYTRSWETGMTDPETAAAGGERSSRAIVERMYDQLREWCVTTPDHTP